MTLNALMTLIINLYHKKPTLYKKLHIIRMRVVIKEKKLRKMLNLILISYTVNLIRKTLQLQLENQFKN